MNDIAIRFISMLRENIDTDKGQAIIMKMLGEMNSSRQDVIAEECEGMVMFENYLSEDEARAIMDKFVNFDGSRGAHWKDADSAFRAISALGIESEKAGEYNRWAFLTVMNMVWSDEWGVLRNYANAEQEARVCAELAVARLEDADGGFSVRRYFRI